MSNIDKQALRGLSVESPFYLAECCNCGEIMPSSKLRESRNYPDDDGECHCPHCNADDCDIADSGAVGSEGVTAWNYQQKRIEALLDELEAAEKRIAELSHHLQCAHAFIEHTEAFGYEASNGILCCGDAQWNIDASKSALAAADKGEAS
ncbi:ead/Ea22-like family protein [Enterobacter asburiae]|nr:ead/Ea22-like family protein [Enterobacter asburiae]